MEVKVIALSCALLAICLSYLPMSDAQVPCTAPGVPVDCIDCDDLINIANPICIISTLLPTTTTAGTPTTAAPGGETTTAAPGGAGGAGKKTRRKRKWKVVKKGGKTVIKRRRNQQNKWNLKG